MLVGINCFMLRRMLRFSRSMARICALTSLAGLEHIARMRDALLIADLADVHHSFHAFRELNKRAKVGNAGDRTFDGGSDRELLCNVGPRIAKRLLQSKADAAFGRVHREDDGVNGVAGLHDVGDALHFARP